MNPLDQLAVELANRKWLPQAACRGLDPALFFPERGTRLAPALEVCAGCPVQDDCRDYALQFSSRDLPGVWGGTSERERRRLRAGMASTHDPRTLEHRHPDIAAHVLRLHTQGASLRAIMAETGCHSDTVRGVIERHKKDAAA